MKNFAVRLILTTGIFLGFGLAHGAYAATTFAAGPDGSVPIPSAPVTNTGCSPYSGQWVQYNNPTWIAPLVVATFDSNATLQVTGCSPGQTNYNLVDGTTVLANVYLQIPPAVAGTPQSIVATLVATTAGSGIYHFGEQVQAQSTTAQPMQTLDTSSTKYPSASHPFPTGTTSVGYDHYYPYNWTLNVAKPQTDDTQYTTQVDMALPGILTDGVYFVNASNELSNQNIIEYSNGYVKAELFLTNPLLLPTGDEGNMNVFLSPGQAVNFTLLTSSSLKAIDDAKWGSSTPMSGQRFGFPVFIPWGSEITLTNGSQDNLNACQYTELAQKLTGNTDAVSIRTLVPLAMLPSASCGLPAPPASCGTAPTVPCIFHAYGIKVILYQFWGAVHILDRNNTLPTGVDPSWVLDETRATSSSPPATTTGWTTAGYTAPGTMEGNPNAIPPVSPGDSWRILNVRMKAVQQYFVTQAQQAVTGGWDSVFYDGPYFWTDSLGRVGGDGSRCNAANGECVSLSFARANLLQQIKKAVQAINPNATVGMLVGNQYFDQTHATDYVVREGVNFNWLASTELDSKGNPYQSAGMSGLQVQTEYGPWDTNGGWLTTQAPYVQNNLVWGSKGVNPLLPASSILWGSSMSGLPALNTYTDAPQYDYTATVADLDYNTFDDYSSTMSDVRKYWGVNMITQFSPATGTPNNPTFMGIGPSLVQVPQNTTVTTNHVLPAIDLTTMKIVAFSTSFQLAPDNLYVFAERPFNGGSSFYSREYFAYFSNTTMLAGGLLFSERPLLEGTAAPGQKGSSIVIYGQAIAPFEQASDINITTNPPGITGLIPEIASQATTPTTYAAPVKLWSPNAPTAVWAGNSSGSIKQLSSSCPKLAPSGCFTNNGLGVTWIYIPVTIPATTPATTSATIPTAATPALKLEIDF